MCDIFAFAGKNKIEKCDVSGFKKLFGHLQQILRHKIGVIMKKFIKSVSIIITALMVVMTVAVSGAFYYLYKYSDSKVDEILLEHNNSSAGTLLYYYDFTDRKNRIGEEKPLPGEHFKGSIRYKYAPYSEMPENLVNAFIAVEDKNFYRHDGVDFPRTLKAGLNYIMKFSSSFGASTITQQLVKNLTGNDEITVTRKIKEMFSAMDLERRCDKTEILEMYLNIINLSDGCRGVGAAAEYYFSKDLSQLSLQEAACIAAITNNPSKYNPITHPENNIYRRNLILKCMLEQGYITESEYEEAKNSDLSLNTKKDKESNVNSWYVDMVAEDVIRDLCQKYNMNKDAASIMLYTGGLKIYTAIDPEIQEILDDYYSDTSNFPIEPNKSISPQSSMIVIDPYTGDILGVAGAIGKKQANRIQNYATDTRRPPGSAIKPLSVYAPAFERKLIKWSSIIEDSPITDLKSGRPWPANSNKTYVGDVDIQYAVSNSLNTVAVKVLHMVGDKNSFDFLKNTLGMTSLISPEKNSTGDCGDAALALGQPNYGVTLRELVGAYSIFEDGVYSSTRSYYKVTDSEGNILLQNEPVQNVVLSRENAAIMTKLLESVVDSGTARGQISLDSVTDVAGKTGTTQDNCDRLFVGYTPELLSGVWFGYDYPESLSSFGRNQAVRIWDDVMNKIFESGCYGTSVKHFSTPDSIYKLTYNRKTGEYPSIDDDKRQITDGWFCDD